MISRKTPPSTTPLGSLPAINPHVDYLGTGVPIYFLNGGVDDVVKLQLIFRAGTNNESLPLAASAVVKLLKGGTSTKSALQIEEWLDYYGASFNAVALNDIISVSVSMLSKHLSPVLKILPEIIFQPKFPAGELALEMHNMLTQFTVSLDKVDFLARRQFKSQIFGPKHPYGFLLEPDHFKAVDREHLLEYHKTWITPENLMFVVSGKLPNNMMALMRDSFGDYCTFSSAPVAQNPVAFDVTPGQQKMYIEKPGAIQSALRLGGRTINKKHPDYIKLEITNALLGGFFGSRLMTNIRQEKGLTYGIHSALVSMIHDGFFFISAQTANTGLSEALHEIYNEIEALRQEPPDKMELDNLRNYLAGQLLRNFDGPFAMAQRLKEVLIFDLEFDFYNKFLETIHAITPEEVQKTAFTYFNPGEMFETIAGGGR